MKLSRLVFSRTLTLSCPSASASGIWCHLSNFLCQSTTPCSTISFLYPKLPFKVHSVSLPSISVFAFNSQAKNSESKPSKLGDLANFVTSFFFPPENDNLFIPFDSQAILFKTVPTRTVVSSSSSSVTIFAHITTLLQSGTLPDPVKYTKYYHNSKESCAEKDSDSFFPDIEGIPTVGSFSKATSSPADFPICCGNSHSCFSSCSKSCCASVSTSRLYEQKQWPCGCHYSQTLVDFRANFDLWKATVGNTEMSNMSLESNSVYYCEDEWAPFRDCSHARNYSSNGAFENSYDSCEPFTASCLVEEQMGHVVAKLQSKDLIQYRPRRIVILRESSILDYIELTLIYGIILGLACKIYLISISKIQMFIEVMTDYGPPEMEHDPGFCKYYVQEIEKMKTFFDNNVVIDPKQKIVLDRYENITAELYDALMVLLKYGIIKPVSGPEILPNGLQMMPDRSLTAHYEFDLSMYCKVLPEDSGNANKENHEMKKLPVAGEELIQCCSSVAKNPNERSLENDMEFDGELKNNLMRMKGQLSLL